MLFTSVSFIVLFTLTLLIYYLLPHRFRWVWLSIASFSYYIYVGKWQTLFLFASILISYFLGIGLQRFSERRMLKRLLIVSGVLLHVALLLVYKYLNMFIDTTNYLLSLFHASPALQTVSLVAPVGISFYVFRVISYLVDISRGKIAPEKNPIRYALYVSFFPQIVSGPIERADHFFEQISLSRRYDHQTVRNGAVHFLWGLFKKLVIADRLSLLVDQVFADLPSYSSPAHLIAVLFFTLQIYFDFSGYSDMAMGCVEMLGMESPRNFERPYFASSIADLWRRWHISLSTWFRDYIYFPLGGSRVPFIRWAFNVLVIFLVSGLWHGAAWTFVIWGLLHGIYQIIGKLLRKPKDAVLSFLHIINTPLHTFFARLITFMLTAYAWLFFKASSLSDAVLVTRSFLHWEMGDFTLASLPTLGLTVPELILTMICVGFVFLIECIQEHRKTTVFGSILNRTALPLRWLFYLLLIFTCILFGIYGGISSASFIYFQF